MRRALAVAIALALGCGAPESTPTYTAAGDVVAVDAAARTVTIRHDDIPGLMGPMTMAFPVDPASIPAGVGPGTRVRFRLARRRDALRVTEIGPLPTAATPPRPGLHDHTPHHGGVVTMVGMLHLEALALADGTIRVYLTDVWRRPLPLADVRATVTLDRPEGRERLPLTAGGEALEARTSPLPGARIGAHVALERTGDPITANFVLALRGDGAGAAGVPSEGCVPPTTPRPAGVRAPRCTIAFSAPVNAIDATPDGATVLIAVSGTGLTAWRMPAVEFVLGFAPAPPISASPEAAPHADAANAVAVSPTGAEVAVAIENRILVYETASGRLRRELPPLLRAIRALAWSPDASRLLATIFWEPHARLLAADDGRELRRLAVEREGAGIAFSADGSVMAVGGELGQIALYEASDDAPPREWRAASRAVVALAFAGDRLVAGDAGGTLRVWDRKAGEVVGSVPGEHGIVRVAVAPGGRVVASAGYGGTIRLHDTATGTVSETLAEHQALVWGLAWAGSALISGDGRGHVAVWDLADLLSAPR